MFSLLFRWAASAFAVALAARLVAGIQVDGGIESLLAVALILGLVNALVRPLLSALACGVIVLTLGLFLLVINAAMLLLTAEIAGYLGIGFTVDGFAAALLGSIIISMVSFVLSLLLPGKKEDR
ncbi:MAG TPA: phage holin family protein [Longimicrobiaceae bacterium]|nr:phage holin family protein [Longimicrobiaceae bacterium]